MLKIFLVSICSLLFSLGVDAQIPAADTTAAIDTAAILNDLATLLNSTNTPVSFASASVGMGNRLFSVRNNRLNAKQATSSTLVYTPSFNYFHKSGFNILASANLLNDDKKGFGASQYAVSPGYDYVRNKNLSMGISYTHYFVWDVYSAYLMPIQNDWFGYFKYNNYWLQPAIAFGYATGNYKEIKKLDTVINNIRRILHDTATYKLKSFSMILSAGHSFKWGGLLNAADRMVFSPLLILNLGSSTTHISHKTNAPLLLNFLNRTGRLPKLQTSSFKAESVGLSLNMDYSIGKFAWVPQLYLDYYLPKTDDDKFISLFTFSVLYTF